MSGVRWGLGTWRRSKRRKIEPIGGKEGTFGVASCVSPASAAQRAGRVLAALIRNVLILGRCGGLLYISLAVLYIRRAHEFGVSTGNAQRWLPNGGACIRGGNAHTLVSNGDTGISRDRRGYGLLVPSGGIKFRRGGRCAGLCRLVNRGKWGHSPGRGRLG